MDPKLLDILVQGGAIGISLVLIGLIYKISEHCADNAKKITDVVSDNARCLEKLTDSVQANTTMTNEMADGIRSMTEMARAAMKITSRNIPTVHKRK